MTGREFKETRLGVGLTLSEVARQLDCAKSTVSQWERNITSVPAVVAEAMRTKSGAWLATPWPMGWKPKGSERW